MNFQRSVIIAELWHFEVIRRGNFVCNFLRFIGKTTVYGKIFKILFQKFLPPHRSTLLCLNIIKFLWWEIGEIVRYLPDKKTSQIAIYFCRIISVWNIVIIKRMGLLFWPILLNCKMLLWCVSVAAFTQLGYRLSPQFAQLVVTRYDPQAKQRLTLDNFIQACVLLKSVTDTFRQKDKNMSGVIQISYEEFLTMVLCNKP